MEGEGRKRKIQNEDEEDQKMEKFFALIRSTRDMREMILASQKDKSKGNNKDGKELAVQNPTFHPQDFLELDKSKASGGSSSSHHHQPHQRARTHEGGPSNCEANQRSKDVIDLDLNLSL